MLGQITPGIRGNDEIPRMGIQAVQGGVPVMRRIWFANGIRMGGIVVVAAGLAGCSHMEAVTSVQDSGAWTRTNIYRQNKSSGQMNIGGQLSDTYVLPEGSPWKIQKTVESEEVTYTASCSLRLGATLAGDVRVRDQKGKPPVITNTVSVKELAPGRFRYREVLKWSGAKSGGIPVDQADPEVTKALKQALPASVRTDQAAQKLALDLQRSLVRVIFGPDENLLPQALFQPTTMERRLRRAIGKSVARALDTQFGSRLTAEEKRQTVIRIVRSMADATEKKSGSAQQSGPAAATGKDDSTLTTLTFTLRVPGKILRTNGEVDEYTNEVWWTMYSPAVSLGEIVMEAEWEVPKRKP